MATLKTTERHADALMHTTAGQLPCTTDEREGGEGRREAAYRRGILTQTHTHAAGKPLWAGACALKCVCERA